MFSKSKKSTQKEVVSDVKALSALLYAAAIRPNRNVIPIPIPRLLLSAISGNNRSGFGIPFIKGISILFLFA